LTRCRPLDLAELDAVSVAFFNRGMAILAALGRWLSLRALRGDRGTRKIWGVKDWLGARCATDAGRSGVAGRAGEEVEDSTD
jgi:hypothetical protein